MLQLHHGSEPCRVFIVSSYPCVCQYDSEVAQCVIVWKHHLVISFHDQDDAIGGLNV